MNTKTVYVRNQGCIGGILVVAKWLARDQTGKPLRMVGVDIDITEHKRAETARLQDSKLESVGILAGGIAHDFNNYLMTILGSITLAKFLFFARSGRPFLIYPLQKPHVKMLKA